MLIASTQNKHSKLIGSQASDIEALAKRVASLEAREDVLLARAEKAAAQAAAQTVTDLALRVGYLQGSARRGERDR